MSERFAWIYDKTRQAKIWCADMWSRKAVLAIRTAITGITSRLTTIENAGYQTASDVSSAIAAAIGGVTELEYIVVSTLPATGSKGVIYLVPHQHDTRDIYDEYIWVNNTFEKIGSTDVDLSGYLKDTDISAWAKASTKPSYTAAEVGALPDTTEIPSKTSQLTNDSGFITSVPVTSVNGKTGTVNLSASDVGALPSSTAIPSKTSDLTNDSGYITASAVPDASTITPAMDGTGTAGSSADYARADHVHPSDTAKQDALTEAQLAAVNSGITAEKVVDYDELKAYTLTYTSNSYVTEAAFKRLAARKVGPHLAILSFNLLLSAAMDVTEFVTIGSISGISLEAASYMIIPGQLGNGAAVTVNVTASGAIRLYSHTGAAGEWYRTMIPLIIK